MTALDLLCPPGRAPRTSCLQVVTIDAETGEVIVEEAGPKEVTTTYTTTLKGFDPVICEGVRAATVFWMCDCIQYM